ncbi:MAG: hypothetical protein JSW26_12580 [Desulfobacterales bacterium]|nr:MAG: hypothetical protein JSW26_12580 [Desulfobacterales bacterium]
MSVVILSLLVVIVVGLIITQSRHNPAILSGNDIWPSADRQNRPSPPSALEAFSPLPQGLNPLTAPEDFDADNLSDKINGKAELYLSAGFKRLVSQRFKDDEGASDRWIEAFVYDMGNGQNAFAVFSAQRRENAESLELTQYAYRSPNAIFLVHGRFYLELIASEASAQVMQPMEMLAAAFVRNTPTEKITMAEQDLFPPKGLVKDSIALVAADAFGFDRLNRVYTAEYRLNGETLMAYLSRRQTPGEAEALAAEYENFLLNFGGQALEQQLPIENARQIEILDTYEVVFSYGPFMAGVREAATRDQAAELAIQFINQIREVAGEF